MSGVALVDQYRMIVIRSIAEVRRDILQGDLTQSEEAWLYHQLGALYGQLGDFGKQKQAWEKAKELDPESQMINSSLESLST